MRFHRLVAGYIFGIILATSPAFAQDSILDWARNHASVVSGMAAANGESVEFVAASLDVDFEVKGRLRSFGYLHLFDRQRVVGPSDPDSEVPVTPEGLALYSAGEIGGGAYFQWVEKVAFECRGGITFEMRALVGRQGDPVDGSKILGACGIRLSGAPGRVSVLAGHYGPVLEGKRLYGFIPSTVVSGEFRLTDTSSFMVDVAAGRDLETAKAVTSARFAVRKEFR